MENAYRYADKDIRGAADDSKYRVLYISKNMYKTSDTGISPC
jgi:hypothetical protein